ncbi:LysR family transcriptional regulator [Paludibacterium paludis]|uniref:LysR family transcriptional regulator n=1 Tax=Paludibacterium paludis TaxID=1225769 RepID=A0A918P654_9NEIS|nr:LysR family transcriptional regulator [Paludibacterium paludis]GGY24701.1 LysR family transcriptional regulator [Paludibacterium paludis]
MKVFCQVVDSGSMANAARVLALAPASVTGTVARLERHLGVSLLRRSTRTLGVTEAGEAWYRHARQILRQTAEAEETAKKHAREPHGRLRVTASAGVARSFLYPWLPDFCRQYPLIGVDLHISDRLVDLRAQGMDLALRTGPVTGADYVALPLARYPHLTCASPAYLAMHGTPAHPDELERHACLTYQTRAEWRYQAGEETLDYTVTGHLVSNDANALLAWAEGGLGIVRQPAWAVAAALKEGRLTPLLEAYTVRRTSQLTILHAVLPEQGFRPRKVEAFLAALRRHAPNVWPGTAEPPPPA